MLRPGSNPYVWFALSPGIKTIPIEDTSGGVRPALRDRCSQRCLYEERAFAKKLYGDQLG